MLLVDWRALSRQHRTFYCYILLSVWIFLLIAGMCRYLGHHASTIHQTLNFLNKNSNTDPMLATHLRMAGMASNLSVLAIKSYRMRCTPLDEINRVDDGGILDGWKLQGVLLVLRHGDRGPMSHLRTIPHLNCGLSDDSLLKRYRNFLQNSSIVSAATANHRYWNKIGPFHGFPLLPLDEKECLLGQLTYKGVAQLLRVGEILHQIYARPLGLWTKQYTYAQTSMDGGGGDPLTTNYPQLMISDEVVLYTTRVRRTFQSALAFFYSFLPNERWLELNVRESHSLAFCFTDCVCAKVDQLRKTLQNLQQYHLSQHSSVLSVMETVANSLFELNLSTIQRTTAGDPHEIIDALNTIVCHDAGWPCLRIQNATELPHTEINNNNDFINIDQDQDQEQEQDKNQEEQEQDRVMINRIERQGFMVNVDKEEEESRQHCIRPHHIISLMSFLNWQNQQANYYSIYKRVGLLRAYGMIRHIVSYMLRMISGDRTKFVLYMGHDWTLRYLTATLGIAIRQTYIGYAARLAFEVYRSEAHTEYYFRVVFNGQDVTQQIDFCEGGKSLRITRDSRGKKADLCPIENIIRFLHEDYFVPLNATNFKDACSIMPNFSIKNDI